MYKGYACRVPVRRPYIRSFGDIYLSVTGPFFLISFSLFFFYIYFSPLFS